MTINFDTIKALGGPLFIIFWGMVVLLLDLGKTGEARRRTLPGISIFGVIVAAFLSVTSIAATQSATGGPHADAATFFGGGMMSDRFGALFCLILCIVAALAIFMSDRYLAEKGINHGEFYALILFSTAGAMLMAMSYDLVNVFVGLEVLSVSLYILSGFARRERRSEEAAVKYFLLGAFASGFLLYGIALIYGSVGFAMQKGYDFGSAAPGAGFTNLEVIREALFATQLTTAPIIDSPIFIAGVAMVIVGLGFKAALVPFHSYAPDVYEGAPTPVTAFMSVAAKIGAFAALIRLLQTMAASGSIGTFHNVIWGIAVATMVVGNVLAIRQTNIKRMLAYSSIAHAGYILVGVLATTALDPAAAQLAQNAIRYYLFAYTFMNLGAFATVVWLGNKGHGDYVNVRDYDGLGKRQPLAAAAMTVIMLSLAGIPPTAGFIGKLYLFMSAFQAGEPVLATIGLVVSAVGVFYYLSIIVAMYFREPAQPFAIVRGAGAQLSALLCVVAILFFGVFPGASGAFAPTAFGDSTMPAVFRAIPHPGGPMQMPNAPGGRAAGGRSGRSGGRAAGGGLRRPRGARRLAADGTPVSGTTLATPNAEPTPESTPAAPPSPAADLASPGAPPLSASPNPAPASPESHP